MGQAHGADVRAAGTVAHDAPAGAREVERQMTNDEPFSLLVSVMETNPVLPFRDERIPEGVSMSAGYVPGVPRLGVPALLMSDAGTRVRRKRALELKRGSTACHG